MIKKFWFAAKSPTQIPYPCRCNERSLRDCGTQWCSCWGRVDLVGLPSDCCARRHLNLLTRH